MSHGYSTTNVLPAYTDQSLLAWGSAYGIGINRLRDGKQDEIASSSSTPISSPQTMTMSFIATASLQGFALLGHNMASGACTVTVQGADNAGMSTNLVTAKAATTVVATVPNHRDTLLQFPAVNKRYWRLTFAHSGTKVITIGEILALSSIVTLSRMKAYGHGEHERYVTNRTESRTGNVNSTYLAGPLRTKKLNFKDMVGTTEREELMNMWRATRGGSTNLLWVETVDSSASAGSAASQECLWVKMQEALGWTEPDRNLFDVDGFELVGLGREAGA